MKKISVLICAFMTMTTYAQKSIGGLINAEKSFAAYSVAHGTKEAFLKFLDSTAVVFDGGQAVNGIALWEKRAARPGVLNWHPQFAEIAASGDFGYTSGPWAFHPQTLNDSVVARGQFNSIWQMNKNGEWKNILDIGNNLPVNEAAELHIINADKIAETPLDLIGLVKAEEKFVKGLRKNPPAAYQQFLSAQSILNHNGYAPATTKPEQEKVISRISKNIIYTITSSRIAASGDLGYVYGATQSADKNDNYLRVWRKEKSGWKIALEVMHQ